MTRINSLINNSLIIVIWKKKLTKDHLTFHLIRQILCYIQSQFKMKIVVKIVKYFEKNNFFIYFFLK